MALTIEDQGLYHKDFLWENHSCGSSKYDNLSESKENMKSLNQQEEKDELINKKQGRDQSNVNIASGEGKDGKCCDESNNHGMHTWTERERRKKMRNLFANLHALLPHLHAKADKSTIVEEAVSYIKNLEQTLVKLEKQKQERVQSRTSNALSFPKPQQVAFDKTWASSNMVLSIFENEAQFSICAPHKPGLMTTIAFVMDKYKIEVISANISNMGNGNAYMIQVHGKRTNSDQFPDANSVEEIYKQAAEEIMLGVA